MTSALRHLFLAAASALAILPVITGISVAEGEELIGTAAPAWGEVEWIRQGPLSLESLRGRVVLVRWWAGPSCPYCRASAPYLNAWQREFSDSGLTIIGFYHHKSPEPLTRAGVEHLADDLGFGFPVAIDPGWRTLKRWWLDRDRGFTSVSFLLDREGVIRAIHPGGSYSKAEAAALERTIRMLLD
jgi:thiol-disulfide isomerase/thioredoxin